VVGQALSAFRRLPTRGEKSADADLKVAV